MNARSGRALLWGTSALLLLVAGFALFVAVASRLASGDAEAVRETRQGLAVYAAVVLIKGLLPQVVLTLALYLGIATRARLESTPARMVAGVVLCSLVAGAVAAGLLLPLQAPGVPGVVFPSAGNFLATVGEMSAAVSAAALLPRWLVPSLRVAGS